MLFAKKKKKLLTHRSAAHFSCSQKTSKMYIIVRTLDGKKQESISVSKLTLVQKLKEQVEKELKIPKEKQILLFKGKRLEDDSTLFDYNIELTNVVQVIYQYV